MKKSLALIPLAVALVLAYLSFYTVDETEQVLVLRFGTSYVETVREPGLHFKSPFNLIKKYDKRLLRHDARAAEILTRDKKALVVDSYVRYRISDPLKFFQTLGNISVANARLDSIIASALRDAVASHDQSDIITEKREPIMAEVAAIAREKSEKFGVEIVDVRIKRTDFPREIAESIYARMRAERTRVSKGFRAQGAEEQLKIMSRTDKERTIILAEAKRKSAILRGEGDAIAIKTFADALGQDPEFYAFQKSLEIYRQSLGKGTRLVLSADSPLFRYLEAPRRGSR